MVRSVLVGAAIFMGGAIGAAPIASAQSPLIVAPLSSCGDYINVDGDCVQSPDHTPGNYRDRDNTNSHSEHKQGSGSWHGGTGKSKK